VLGLVKVALVLAVLGVVVYDAGAVVVNHVQVDELGQSALRAAVQRTQAPGGTAPAAVAEAAQAGLARSDRAELGAAVVDTAGVHVTVRQDARVLVLDRLGPLADLVTAEVTKTAVPG
jgi:hypothetical protein